MASKNSGVYIYQICLPFSKIINTNSDQRWVLNETSSSTNTFSTKSVDMNICFYNIISTDAITLCPSFPIRDSRDFALCIVSVQRDGKEEY